jgi:hypothetical protein
LNHATHFRRCNRKECQTKRLGCLVKRIDDSLISWWKEGLVAIYNKKYKTRSKGKVNLRVHLGLEPGLEMRSLSFDGRREDRTISEALPNPQSHSIHALRQC